jgi:hypothetical protein
MTGTELRHALADAAAGALPDDWTAYPGPPEQVAFPCIVVVPRSPWLVPMRFCEGVYAAALTLLVPRAQGVQMLDTLDTWAEPVRKAATAIAGVRWEGTDLGPMIAPGGVEAYGASINLQIYP